MTGEGKARLKTVTRTQGANRALKDGSVQPRRASLQFEEVPVLVHAFRRMVRQLEFDVCEMAFTTYLCAKAYGVRMTALPVFLVRGFHHGAIVRRPDALVREPADLAGTRVGVNRGYTVTTGVWARVILAEEHGVNLDEITWVVSADDHVTAFRPPPNVTRLDAGQELDALLDAGTLSAVVGVTAAPPRTEPLIPEPEEAGFRALAQRGFYPINHTVVVRDELLEEDPPLAADLFEAFAEAKNRYVSQLRSSTGEQASDTDNRQDPMYRRVMEITGGDPLPYGIEPNRTMIETLIDHALRQHILPERPSVPDLFAPAARLLVA
jgi:4,5-dihydroxyphthalate decarboxylase